MALSPFRLDYETTSKCDIANGAYRYAADPSTRILMFAVKERDLPVRLWNFLEPDSKESRAAKRTLAEAIAERELISAFNVGFEIAISRYRLFKDVGLPEPELHTYRCSQAVCRRSGMPVALADAAKALELEIEKDTIGKKLINIFSDQTKLVKLRKGSGKATQKMVTYNPVLEKEIPWDWELTLAGETVTVRQAWDMFCAYCRKDVLVEEAVERKMERFELKGDQLAGFQFDMRMNYTGVPVDVPALTRANKLIIQHKHTLTERFVAITKLGPKQNVEVRKWLQKRGYRFNSIDKDSRERSVENPEGLTAEAKEAIECLHLISYAAVDKVAAMLRWVCPDGRIRGAFTWHGAQKTGRWTSQGPQWQNMKKPSKKMKRWMTHIYQAISHWADNDDLAYFFGNPYEVLASCSRYFVRDPDGPIYDVDFAQVEARILPALINCERILDKFRRGEDIYIAVAEKLNTTRDMGKIVSLLCQFAGGWRAVKDPLGDAITEKEARLAVKVYRKENPEVVTAWSTFQDTFVEALNNPGKWCNASPHVKFGYTAQEPFPRIQMRLPSGRDIVYPWPRATKITMVKVIRTPELDEDDDDYSMEWIQVEGHCKSKEECEIKLDVKDKFLFGEGAVSTFFHTHDLSFWGHVKGKFYGRVKTYGGDLLQSATQGTGMDFLMHGCVVAEERGFEPFFVVHDEALAKGKGGIDNFIDALCTRPSWFPDFPLEADGEVKASYSKD